MLYIPKGNCLTNLVHGKYALAGENNNVDLKTTLSICLYKTFSNMRYDSFVAES